eukprot:SAG11_NODE_41233_length_196_cov_66.402062_1_plen_34_part_10
MGRLDTINLSTEMIALFALIFWGMLGNVMKPPSS